MALTRTVGKNADVMTIFTLLLAVLLAAPVFAATVFSAAQVYLCWTRRWLSMAHLASVIATLAGMAAIQYGTPSLALVAGLPLLISSSMALCLERRWNRLFPPFQTGLAVVLLSYPSLTD